MVGCYLKFIVWKISKQKLCNRLLLELPYKNVKADHYALEFFLKHYYFFSNGIYCPELPMSTYFLSIIIKRILGNYTI